MKKIFVSILFSLFVFGVSAQMRYVELAAYPDFPSLQIKSIDDFERIVREERISTGYLFSEKGSSMLFVLTRDNKHFSFALGNCKTLEQYRAEKLASERNESSVAAAGSSVYWTEHGKKFHLYEDCQALDRSEPLVNGSAQEAIGAGKGAICKFCEKRHEKEVAAADTPALPEAVNQ